MDSAYYVVRAATLPRPTWTKAAAVRAAHRLNGQRGKPKAVVLELVATVAAARRAGK